VSLVLRPAQPTDAGKTGDILWRFITETPWMPDLHTGAETIAFCGMMIDMGWVTVAELNGAVSGFLARDGAMIHALYIARAAHGSGVGRALLTDAKTRTGDPTLWCFQPNKPAQRFYLREGFVEAERTDGATDEEQLPDIRYVWSQEAAE